MGILDIIKKKKVVKKAVKKTGKKKITPEDASEAAGLTKLK